MIEVVFEGGVYGFSKNANSQGSWLGIGPRRGKLHPGPQCIAPLMIWGELRAIAVSEGHAESNFSAPVKEVKEVKPRRASAEKKSNGPTISIFNEV